VVSPAATTAVPAAEEVSSAASISPAKPLFLADLVLAAAAALAVFSAASSAGLDLPGVDLEAAASTSPERPPSSGD